MVNSVLLIVDMINPFTFPGARKVLPMARRCAERLARLKRRVDQAGVSTIYVNDNFGIWRSDLQTLVRQCLNTECTGRPIVRLLKPNPRDYFVLKPRHSGFYATPLGLLLKHLEVRRVIITGIAGNNCVLYTAADAYMRDFEVSVPADCTVSLSTSANRMALLHMERTLKTDIRHSARVEL
jgi:nicotinamidase-related amidase